MGVQLSGRTLTAVCKEPWICSTVWQKEKNTMNSHVYFMSGFCEGKEKLTSLLQVFLSPDLKDVFQ